MRGLILSAMMETMNQQCRGREFAGAVEGDKEYVIGGSEANERATGSTPAKNLSRQGGSCDTPPSVNEAVSLATQRLLDEAWARDELKKQGIKFTINDNGINSHLDELDLSLDHA